MDFHKDGYLATAGADKEVKLWRVEEDADGAPTVKHLESLTGSHNRGINVVRFAPSGDVLASGVRRPDPPSARGRRRRPQRSSFASCACTVGRTVADGERRGCVWIGVW